MTPLQGLDPVPLPSVATHAPRRSPAEGVRREDHSATPADDRD